MGLFDRFRQPDMEQGVARWEATPGALLLDVRTPQEYSGGHIPGSQNIPLQVLDRILQTAENKDTPLFVYCQSGARSRQATALLGQMGYTDVTNLGGITAWTGKVVR